MANGKEKRNNANAEAKPCNPFGEITASPERGTFLDNRGVLHNGDGLGIGVKEQLHRSGNIGGVNFLATTGCVDGFAAQHLANVVVPAAGAGRMR
jgi:hypothetical protein